MTTFHWQPHVTTIVSCNSLPPRASQAHIHGKLEAANHYEHLQLYAQFLKKEDFLKSFKENRY